MDTIASRSPPRTRDFIAAKNYNYSETNLKKNGGPTETVALAQVEKKKFKGLESFFSKF